MVAFVPCPACGTQIHPIASRCKYCRCDVTTRASVLATPEVAHPPSRAAWTAVAFGLIAASTLALAGWSRFHPTDDAPPEPVAAPVPGVAPIPEATVAPVKPRDKLAALEGIWKGVGDQPDLAITWPVEVKLERIGPVGTKVGTIKFGSPLGCSGELERSEDDGDQLVLHETVTTDPDTKCVTEATLKLTPDGDKLRAVWIYTNGAQAASGDLTR